MTRPFVKVNGYVGPTLDDCTRLWTTIIRELMSDAALEIRLPILPLGQDRPKVIVTSGGFDADTGKEKRHVWAAVELNNIQHAFSYAQLHSLLSLAYARMEGYLQGQTGLWDERSEGQ